MWFDGGWMALWMLLFWAGVILLIIWGVRYALIAEGAHPRAIMERMGHSTIQVTLGTYGHVFPSLEASLTQAPDDVYRTAEPARPADVPSSCTNASFRPSAWRRYTWPAFSGLKALSRRAPTPLTTSKIASAAFRTPRASPATSKVSAVMSQPSSVCLTSTPSA